MPLLGIDAYHGDSGLSFHDLAQNGVVFCFLKCSQGARGTDPAYRGYYDRAKSVGLTTGAYHFFTEDDPIQQAHHFLKAADLKSGDLVHALDVETLFGDVGARAKACAEEIKDQTGRWPIIYSGDSFFQDNLVSEFLPADFTLWIARYSSQKPQTPCVFWQFSDHGAYPANPPLDTSHFFGTLKELQAHCI